MRSVGGLPRRTLGCELDKTRQERSHVYGRDLLLSVACGPLREKRGAWRANKKTALQPLLRPDLPAPF